MTTQATEYSFTAAINSKGRQGSNWKIEFDWKLPGSRFPFVLYGREDSDIEGWNVGDTPRVTVTQGSLKSGKTGQYPSDFFYDLVSMETPVEARIATGPRPAFVKGGPPVMPEDYDEPEPQWPEDMGLLDDPTPPPPSDYIQARIEKGMAFNAAVALVTQEREHLPLSTLFGNLRQLRDALLHGVIQVPVAPPRYCYEHEAERVQSPRTGVWGHILANGKGCVDTGAGAAAPATGSAEEE